MTFYTYMMRNHKGHDTAAGRLAEDMYQDRDHFPRYEMGTFFTGAYGTKLGYLRRHSASESYLKAFDECWAEYEKAERARLGRKELKRYVVCRDHELARIIWAPKEKDAIRRAVYWEDEDAIAYSTRWTANGPSSQEMQEACNEWLQAGHSPIPGEVVVDAGYRIGDKAPWVMCYRRDTVLKWSVQCNGNGHYTDNERMAWCLTRLPKKEWSNWDAEQRATRAILSVPPEVI